jgi:cell division protein FtsZ
MPTQAPTQAQARNSLYAYSQAVVQGTTLEPAVKTSTAVAESMAAETLAVGTSRVAIAPEVPASPEAPMAEPSPQDEAFVEVMEAPVTDSFIAPLPAVPEPASEPEIRAPTPARADPFATAALENGSRAPRGSGPAAVKGPASRSRVPGFFAKMTGGASRAIQAATQGGERRDTQGAAAQDPVQPVAQPVTQPGAGHRTSAEPKLRAPAAQPPLSGLESAGPESAGQVDEELLDIPAFLRRQAN